MTARVAFSVVVCFGISQSDSFVFQKCMYYVPHIRLKNCSITKIWGSTEAVSWLTESQVDLYWILIDEFHRERKKEREI